MTRTPKDAARAADTEGWKASGTGKETEGPDDIARSGPGGSTDESFTPPHGDPERRHLDREDDAGDDEEGPGPAEGHTDNKAGG